MCHLAWGLLTVLGLAAINAVAVWFGADIAGEPEPDSDHH
jgi:hypothetical protein